MRKIFVIVLILAAVGKTASAQIDLDKILDPKKIININDIIGKALSVKKGFAPKFSLGNVEIPKVTKVAQIFNVKGSAQALKLFNTFKTGRTIYRIVGIAGSAIAAYGVIKKIDKASLEKDYKAPLIAGLSSIGAGLLTKFLTKAAAYKAVDVFNGIARKKLGDILSVKPAESSLGIGLFVKL